jgi:hypothetical protein
VGGKRSLTGWACGDFGKRVRTMKISARNRLKGKVVDVKKGQTTAHVAST